MTRDVNHPAAVGAAALTAGAAVLAFNMMPFVVGSIADTYGYAAERLGYIATAYMAGYTIMTVALVFWVRRVDWRRTCLWIGILQLGGFALTPSAGTFQSLATLFFITGLCGGLLFGTAMTSLADTRNPDRSFGLGSLSQVGLGAIVAFFLPRLVIPDYGFQGVMWMLAGGAGLIVVMSRLMPSHGVVTEPGVEISTSSKGRSLDRLSRHFRVVHGTDGDVGVFRADRQGRGPQR